MSGGASGALAAGLCLVALGCQAAPPETPPPPPPVPREVLTHFQLADPSKSSEERAIPILGVTPAEAGPGVDLPPELEIEEVLTSVEVHFPLILAALEEIEIAEGQLTQARGGFDTRLKAKGGIEPQGYYENENLDVWLEQPTQLWGTTFSGGYRIGSGDFPVYDGKQKTNEGGELRAGLTVPLLQGGRIDPRRVELWRARIGREQAEPIIVQKRLEATRKAASSYWTWVAAGQRRAIAQRLLDLAQNREEQVELAVREGELAEINLVENRRLIVERQALLVRAERGLQQAAILLSLYWRDAEGRPVVPPDTLLPKEFPAPRPPEASLVPDAIDLALARRPEIRAIELEISALGIDLELARNQMLPELDVGVFASQDVGPAVDDPDDKGPFEVEALLRLSFPLQQRKPEGKQRELAGKIAKLRREGSFVRDVVETDVKDATSALVQSWERLAAARENVVLAGRLEEAERLRLREGQSDLFRVNLREQQTALAASGLVDVLSEHFKSLAEYRAVLGVPYDEVTAGEDVGGAER